MRNKTKIVFSFFLSALMLFSCGISDSPKEICTLVGSTSVEHIAELFKKDFETINSNVNIEIQALGSSAGINALLDNTADIAMSSRDLREGEVPDDYQVMPIAIDGIAVVLHPDNPILSLSLEQIRRIFIGEITNWAELGGSDGEIIVITRESGSGTRDAFEGIVGLKDDSGFSFTENSRPLTADGNGSVKSNVASKPRAIGYISIDILDDVVSAVEVEGFAPTIENVGSKKYPLYREFLFVAHADPSDGASAFLSFIFSPAGENTLIENGLIPVSQQKEDDGE